MDQDSVRNVRTCRPDVKGEAQAAATARAQVPMRGIWAEMLVVGVKGLKWSWTEGASSFGLRPDQVNSKEEEPRMEARVLRRRART